MSDYIKRLIAEGEHQMLDFKFEVSDFRKIARTLVAFANTDGGRLLVGVKDNGAIAGVRSAEEYFMVDGAAGMYCKPGVEFTAREWQVEGKKVVEFIIKRGGDIPYKAQDTDGRWISYIRQGDQNFKANKVLLQVWAKQKEGHNTTIRFRQAERLLLAYLESHSMITISKYRLIAGLSSYQAENIMVDFILLNLIKINHTATSAQFSLTPGYREIIKRLENGIF